jgi:hypothetical protein
MLSVQGCPADTFHYLNIYVMKLSGIEHLYAFIIMCDCLVTNFFYHSITVLSRINVPQLYASCAQLYSARAVWGELDKA